MSVQDVLVAATARAWVTPAITVLLIACFAGSVALGVHPFSPTSEQLLRAGGSFGPTLLDGQWWRLLSAEFLHGGLVHLAFNLWALWGAGRFAERIYGNAGFLAIYLLSAVGATLLSVTVAPLTVSIGASGAVFGVFGALLAFAWSHRGLFPADFLRRQRSSLLAFLGYNVVYAVVDRQIDAAGHAGGLAVGIALGLLLRRDLRDPRAGMGRRLGAVVAMGAVLAAAGLGVRARVAAVPEVRAVVLGREAAAALQAGQLELAVERAGAAIAAEDSWRRRSMRGYALQSLGRGPEALIDLDRAVELAPPDAAGPPALRAGARLDAGNLWGALEDLDQAISRDPRDAWTLNLRAWVRVALAQYPAARADADRALALKPDDPASRGTRCFALAGLGDDDGARRDCARAVELAPPGSPEDRGMLAFLAGDRAGALRLWDAPSRRSPVSQRALAPWMARARGE